MRKSRIVMPSVILCLVGALVAQCAPPPDVRETRRQTQDRRFQEKKLDQYVEQRYLNTGGGEGGY